MANDQTGIDSFASQISLNRRLSRTVILLYSSLHSVREYSPLVQYNDSNKILSKRKQKSLVQKQPLKASSKDNNSLVYTSM